MAISIYITGDLHGDLTRLTEFCTVHLGLSQEKDTMIVLGDAGFNYYGGKRDAKLKQKAANLPITLFCIHGNHETRPENIEGYEEQKWNSGTVLFQPIYPNLLFAKDGEVFNLDGRETLVIGGAYSVDKWYRLEKGYAWFKDEQPSKEIMDTVERQLTRHMWRMDTILSHTCPKNYLPREVFLPFIDQTSVDYSTEDFLSDVETHTAYSRWFCGHFHIDKNINNL